MDISKKLKRTRQRNLRKKLSKLRKMCPQPASNDNLQIVPTTTKINEQFKKIKKVPVKPSQSEGSQSQVNKNPGGKFWKKRNSLFYKYNQGIQLDQESWYSVTPEKIATRIALRCHQQKPGGTVIDPFCGCGGNTIQFAKIYDKVIAIDIDSKRVEMCKNNAAIYGVSHKIEFICGDFFQLAPNLIGDIVFLSPPWGGLSYRKKEVYDLDEMNGTKMFTLASQITPNAVFYLPRNINRAQVDKLKEVKVSEEKREEQNVSIEDYDDHGRCRVVIAFFGELVANC